MMSDLRHQGDLQDIEFANLDQFSPGSRGGLAIENRCWLQITYFYTQPYSYEYEYMKIIYVKL